MSRKAVKGSGGDGLLVKKLILRDRQSLLQFATFLQLALVGIETLSAFMF